MLAKPPHAGLSQDVTTNISHCPFYRLKETRVLIKMTYHFHLFLENNENITFCIHFNL